MLITCEGSSFLIMTKRFRPNTQTQTQGIRLNAPTNFLQYPGELALVSCSGEPVDSTD